VRACAAKIPCDVASSGVCVHVRACAVRGPCDVASGGACVRVRACPYLVRVSACLSRVPQFLRCKYV